MWEIELSSLTQGILFVLCVRVVRVMDFTFLCSHVFSVSDFLWPESSRAWKHVFCKSDHDKSYDTLIYQTRGWCHPSDKKFQRKKKNYSYRKMLPSWTSWKNSFLQANVSWVFSLPSPFVFVVSNKLVFSWWNQYQVRSISRHFFFLLCIASQLNKQHNIF